MRSCDVISGVGLGSAPINGDLSDEDGSGSLLSGEMNLKLSSRVVGLLVLRSLGALGFGFNGDGGPSDGSTMELSTSKNLRVPCRISSIRLVAEEEDGSDGARSQHKGVINVSRVMSGPPRSMRLARVNNSELARSSRWMCGLSTIVPLTCVQELSRSNVVGQADVVAGVLSVGCGDDKDSKGEGSVIGLVFGLAGKTTKSKSVGFMACITNGRWPFAEGVEVVATIPSRSIGVVLSRIVGGSVVLGLARREGLLLARLAAGLPPTKFRLRMRKMELVAHSTFARTHRRQRCSSPSLRQRSFWLRHRSQADRRDEMPGIAAHFSAIIISQGSFGLCSMMRTCGGGCF
jgi:hypothetical protein